MTTDNTVLARQWANRPNDQRFLDLPSLLASVENRYQYSTEHQVALDCLTLGITPGGDIGLTEQDGNARGVLSHYAFGQLCTRAKAPAGYLRSLPADLAVIPLQWSLETHEGGAEANDAKLLTRINGHQTVAAVTSPTYGRIWDRDVVRAIQASADPSVWKVPAASYSAADPLRATTLYASDRDVFVFLCNETTIDVEGESLNRGFYAWNSEVGSATFGLATFTYDRICDNRIIWGCGDFRELKIRHTSGGPHRFAQQASPQLAAYAQSSTLRDIEIIRTAKATEVARDAEGVRDWLKARGFGSGIAAKAYGAAEADPRGYNPRTVWGVVQGVTDLAHDIRNTDERTAVEAKAGELLEALAA